MFPFPMPSIMKPNTAGCLESPWKRYGQARRYSDRELMSFRCDPALLPISLMAPGHLRLAPEVKQQHVVQARECYEAKYVQLNPLFHSI
jgi:hypothetical protein